MKFKNVAIKNFFRFGPNEQKISLEGNGITSITGPNGYGKTTIVEAIIYAIYGKTRQATVNDVVNRYVGKDCKVSLEFCDNKNNYKIIRYRNHTEHGNNIYLFKNDTDISCKNASDTNALIIDIVKMPYLAFINSTVFSSELYTDFLGAKNSDRLVVFENILSLKEINAFYAETKNVVKEITEKENNQKIKLNGTETEMSSINSSIISYTEQAKKKLIEMKSEKDIILKNKEEAENKIKELSSINIDDERKKLSNVDLANEYKTQMNEKINLHSNIREDIEKINSTISSYEEFINKYKDVNFKEEQNKEEKYISAENEIEVKKQAIKELDAKISSKNLEISRSENDLSQLILKNKEYENMMESIKKSICPTCKQEINKEETERQNILINNEIDKNNLQITNLEKNKPLLEEELKKLSNLKVEMESNVKNLSEICRTTIFLKNSTIIENDYNNKINSLNEYKSRHDTLYNQLENLTKEMEDLKSKSLNIELSKYTEEYLNNISSLIEKQKEIINNSNIEASKIDGSVKSIYNTEYIKEQKEKLLKASKENEENISILKNIENEEKYYNYLGECFSNKSGGFKKFFIGEMIDVFNEKINQYLPFFFNEEINITFDKDLNENIKMDDFEVSFNSFSTGQKTRAELSVAFALFSLSRVFFSNDNSLLIVDEMFDRGLDNAGINSAISVLSAFSKNTKIFIVSHNPYIKESIDEKIEIAKDENGFSIIK